MATFTFTCSLDNAAFGTTVAERADELFYAQERIYHALAEGESEGVVRDSNGNNIGTWTITED